MTELNFKGKEFVYNHHLAVPFRPLVPDASKGIGPVALDGNLIIHGDNLHTLKALLPMYAGKIDFVYIDPPYNTGNKEWSYKDDVNSPMIREWFSENPISIDDGLRHDKWLAMMWPRLRLLDQLLSETGVIFLSINTIEIGRLREICEEIFGEGRFIGEFVWKSRNNKDNRNESGLSNDHEFVLIFGNGFDGELRAATDYSNLDNDSRGPWASANMVGLASREKRPNLHYDLIDPETGINYGCPKKGWRFEPSKMNQLIAEKRIIWPDEESGRPRRKAFLSDLDARTNVSSVISGPFYTNNGAKTLTEVLPDVEFSFPKPIELVQFLLSLFERKDLIVLNSFAGSGTTAHAVLKANSLDQGQRKFILVEGEDYAETITAERVRRVISGYTYKGRQRTELLRQRVTWRTIERGQRLVENVQAVENLHGQDFSVIKKEIKDGEIVISGERIVSEKADGLGGAFTYCTIGSPVDLDKILSGDSLPSYAALGAVLFHTATNCALDAGRMDEGEYFLGRTDGQNVWLLYKPDLEWLKSAEAALTLSRAKVFAARDPQAKHLVFAPARYVSQRMLAQHNLPVEFAPLPFALYRIGHA